MQIVDQRILQSRGHLAVRGAAPIAELADAPIRPKPVLQKHNQVALFVGIAARLPRLPHLQQSITRRS